MWLETSFVYRKGVPCVGNGGSREWCVGSCLWQQDTVNVRFRLRSWCWSILSVWFCVDFGAGALLGFLALIVALQDDVWLGLPPVCQRFPAILFATWGRLLRGGLVSISWRMLRLGRFLFVDMVCSRCQWLQWWADWEVDFLPEMFVCFCQNAERHSDPGCCGLNMPSFHSMCDDAPDDNGQSRQSVQSVEKWWLLCGLGCSYCMCGLGRWWRGNEMMIDYLMLVSFDILLWSVLWCYSFHRTYWVLGSPFLPWTTSSFTMTVMVRQGLLRRLVVLIIVAFEGRSDGSHEFSVCGIGGMILIWSVDDTLASRYWSFSILNWWVLRTAASERTCVWWCYQLLHHHVVDVSELLSFSVRVCELVENSLGFRKCHLLGCCLPILLGEFFLWTSLHVPLTC